MESLESRVAQLERQVAGEPVFRVGGCVTLGPPEPAESAEDECKAAAEQPASLLAQAACIEKTLAAAAAALGRVEIRLSGCGPEEDSDKGGACEPPLQRLLANCERLAERIRRQAHWLIVAVEG